MISVVFYKDASGDIKGFDCSGHAGFARRGEDIICAAFSMMVINTVNSLEALTDTVFDCDQDEKAGRISVRLRELDEAGRVLISSMILGIDSMKKEYSEKYITTAVRQV